MVIEEGLNQLPHVPTQVVTPTGCKYEGLMYGKGNCGVSIVRSGEAMEKALQGTRVNLTENTENTLLIPLWSTFPMTQLFTKMKYLPDCCRSMRIGKILVDSDPETHEARVIFAKFPSDIAQRKVLLLYPIMSSGNKVCRAMQVLKENKVPEEHVILINLFSTPQAAQRIVREFPNLTVLTTEVHDVTPNHFGQKYFGTDHTEF